MVINGGASLKAIAGDLCMPLIPLLKQNSPSAIGLLAIAGDYQMMLTVTRPEGSSQATVLASFCLKLDKKSGALLFALKF
jgi:hypothetical protein